jgi:hypothetical protein
LALLATACGLVSGCQKHAVCDEVQGSCMALRIEGRGSYPRLGVELDVEPASGSASRRTGLAPEAVTLPTSLRVLPPPAVLASEVRRVRAYVLDDSGTEAASATMEVSWPEGAHISVTLYLVDGGADLGPGGADLGSPDLAPVPSIQCTADGICTEEKPARPSALFGVAATSATSGFAVGAGGQIWRKSGSGWSAEPSPTSRALYGVWGSGPNQAWSVGERGTILKWDGASWSAQGSGTTRTLYGVWGSSASSAWAVGAGGTIPFRN